jgi:hypothetical protein
MASTILQPVADRLAAILQGLELGVNTWAQPDLRFDRAGAAEIEIPDITRTPLEQPESQLGADDWDLEFPVSLWVNMTQADTAQQRLAALVEAWITAVDADIQLGGLVLEARVTTARRVYGTTGNGRPLVGYETAVAVLKLV